MHWATRGKQSEAATPKYVLCTEDVAGWMGGEGDDGMDVCG